jgi:DNA-binding response OmpR family regulator
MPGMDGFETCRRLKSDEHTQEIPVLFMTLMSDVEDKLKGFALGGDDYISKPFNMELLLARINAIVRRIHNIYDEKKETNSYQIGDFTFEYNHQVLKHKGTSQKLTSKEADLLKLLCEHTNEVLDRRIALNRIWKDDSYFNARSMDVYITKLRKYLKMDERIQIINVHGIGFKLLVDQ